MGLELELEELVERRTRAAVQHFAGDVARLDREIAAVQAELAEAAEAAAAEPSGTTPPPTVHDPDALGITPS